MDRTELVKKLMDSLDTNRDRKEVWVLKNRQGEVLRLSSGKSSWRKKNHASTALSNHINSILYRDDLQMAGFRCTVDVKNFLIESGEIIIEQIF